MSFRKIIALGALCAPAALAQSTTAQTPPGTTTTVQSQPQTQPGTTTTVQTQPTPPPAQQPPSTNVVVNPPPASTTGTRVSTYDTPVVVEEHPRRPALAIIAEDALYGGLIGTAIGGGIALIQQDKNNWGRDLAIGAGAGLIAGGVFGAVQAATQSDGPAAHAEVDRAGNGGTIAGRGPGVAVAGRF